jgi:hypothetical protein
LIVCDIGKWMNAAMKLFAQDWGGWMMAVLLLTLASLFPAVLGALAFALLMAINMDAGSVQSLIHSFEKMAEHPPQDPARMVEALLAGGPVEPFIAFLMIAALALAFMLFLYSIFMPPLTAGLYMAAFNQMRTGKLEPGDIFQGFKVFWPSVIGVSVIGLLTTLGFLLILPGLYLTVASSLMMPLIAEKRLGFWAAFRESRRIIHGDFWRFALFVFAGLTLLSMASSLCFLLVLAAMPVYVLMFAVAVRETVGVEGAKTLAQEEAEAVAAAQARYEEERARYEEIARRDELLRQEQMRQTQEWTQPAETPWPQSGDAPAHDAAPPAPRPAALNFCSQCGARVVTPGARFCEACGRPLAGGHQPGP